MINQGHKTYHLEARKSQFMSLIIAKTLFKTPK